MNSLQLQSSINNAISQIKSLDYYFYENIDSGLIQHPDLCKFASNMENIQVNIINILEHIAKIVSAGKAKCDEGGNQEDKTQNNSIGIQVSNINYSQLQSLGNSITK
jgi:hypothetical protein